MKDIQAYSLPDLQTLQGKHYWRGWEQNLQARSQHRGSGRVAKREVSVDYSKYGPENYLLSWFTAVAGVELEKDGHTVVSPHNKFINDNSNAWGNTVLLESYHSFILAENFSEHVSLPEFSKGKVLDAVAWVVERQYNGYKEPVPTVFIDCLLATNKKKHPRLVSKMINGVLNTVSMGCLLPDSLVTLADGTRKPVQEITEGDYLLNGLGQVDRVKRVMVREVEAEPIYHGKVSGVCGGFDLTGEHPVFLSYGSKSDTQTEEASLIYASHQCRNINSSPDYYRIDTVGVYGWEDDTKDRYYVEEVYPRGVLIPQHKVTKLIAEMTGFMAAHGTMGCQKFEADVIYWDHDLQKALIRGFFQIRGIFNVDTCVMKAESESRDLIDQVYLILLRLGVLASKSVISRDTGNGDNETRYTVTVCVTESESWMSSRPVKHKYPEVFSQNSFFRESSVARPIQEITRSLYTGPVYNLEMESDPSYLTNNIRIHNCDVLFTQCSKCGKVIEEGEDKPCEHIENQLGRYYESRDGKRHRVAELCGVQGKPGSCVFKELSLVAKPAFMLAKLHGFVDYGDESTGRPLKSTVPYSRYRESNKDI